MGDELMGGRGHLPNVRPMDFPSGRKTTSRQVMCWWMGYEPGGSNYSPQEAVVVSAGCAKKALYLSSAS